jgi:hypothetical protein
VSGVQGNAPPRSSAMLPPPSPQPSAPRHKMSRPTHCAARSFLAAVLGSLLALLSACSSSSAAFEEGKGLLSWTREAPEGVELLSRPNWTPGDRFVYRRGGRVRYDFVVASANEQGYVLREKGSQVEKLLDAELRERGRRIIGQEKVAFSEHPYDAHLHWPLWKGKKWSCDFVENSANGLQHIQAFYHCDAIEELTTQAGTFRCWRIWRRVRLVAEEAYYDRTWVYWYSPEVGYWVRQLEGEMQLELEEFERQ